jgi:pimeloyl-ACP methyl ester carboxylesterase
MTTTRTRRIPTRLGSLAVREYAADAPDGPVAVLWHSMFVDSSSWDRMLESLGSRRRLIVVDAPGYGASDELQKVTSIRECAAAVVELLDGLGLTDPVDWVGNAFGGHLGYQLVADAPDRIRTLVAISSPLAPIEPGLRAKLRMLRPVLALLGRAGFLVDMVADAQLTDFSRATDPAAVAIIRDSMGRQSRRSLSMTLASFILGRRDLTAEAEQCRVPALFVASDDRGEWSPEDAAAAAARIPGARSITISWARTLIPVEQPVALSEAILSFWAARSR